MKSHHSVFPQGQFVAISPDGILVGSAGTLNVSLGPEHVGNIWFGIIADDMFANRHPNIDSLWGASISIHQWYKRGYRMHVIRSKKRPLLEISLKKMIAGGRLFNYCERAAKVSAVNTLA